ncbi:MAG: HAMP domain-containing histidine kinase [Deltaproteobacteria bacterium]|nr:HAMP domain-containing histidine kinase [Deltaproteobacteria bacterium]
MPWNGGPSGRRGTLVGWAVVAGLVAGLTALHYLTLAHYEFLHLAYRDLYFLPLFLAAFWFGLRGALLTSLVIILLYVPWLLQHEAHSDTYELSSLIQMGLFVVVSGALGWLSDQARRRREELRQARDLAAMGRAVSAVAHDMKTPLMAIGGFVRQVERTLPPDDPAVVKLEIALHQTARLEAMVRDMLSFARPLDLNLDSVELGALARDVVAVAGALADQREVRLAVETPLGEVTCPADRLRLEQALLNLVNNAVEASEPGQEVVVRAVRVGDLPALEVVDQGPGIPPAQRQEVLQPFFSTKKEGTGLGLAIVNKVVEAHGGQLEILDQTGPGTIFRLTLQP